MDIYTIPLSLETPAAKEYYQKETEIIGRTFVVTGNGELIPLTRCLTEDDLATILKDIEKQAASLERWHKRYNTGTGNHNEQSQPHISTGNPYHFVSLLN